MDSPDLNLAAVMAANEASALKYLRRTSHHEAAVLARVIAERDELRVLAGPVPADDAEIHKIMQHYRGWENGVRTNETAELAMESYEADVPALVARVRLAEAETNQAKGELRGVFLALSHITPEHVTPEWRTRMKAIYLEKGGEPV